MQPKTILSDVRKARTGAIQLAQYSSPVVLGGAAIVGLLAEPTVWAFAFVVVGGLSAAGFLLAVRRPEHLMRYCEYWAQYSFYYPKLSLPELAESHFMALAFMMFVGSGFLIGGLPSAIRHVLGG